MALLTLDDVLVEISLDIDSSATPPAATDAEYTRRLKLANRFERLWATALNYRWPELYTETTSTTTTIGQTYVAMPSDFERGNLVLNKAGEIKIGSIYYKVVDPSDRQTYPAIARVCWFTGNKPSGIRMNIGVTPTQSEIVYLNYYSTNLATDAGGTSKAVMTTGTDQTKCRDPYYLVFGILSVLYKSDDEGAKGQDNEIQAISRLNSMISYILSENENQDMEIPDVAEKSGFPNIGD